MRNPFLFATAAALVVAAPLSAQMEDAAPSGNVDLKEWEVEWGGRTRDPYVAPDGDVWFVGQQGNYIARFEIESAAFQRYEIEDGTNPHNLIVDDEGMVWYAGNRNGRIGKLDPNTGEAEVFMTGEAQDPHTLIFDGRGNIWFTSQQSSRVGRLDMATGESVLVNPHPDLERTRPYGIIVDPDGRPWFNLFNTNMIATIDPQSLEVTRYEVVPEDGRTRRIARTDDGMIWWVDFSRGYVGRFDPATQETEEWLMPGGEESRPYAITADGQGRLWISETGDPTRLVGFNPADESFFSVNDVSDGIRHMMYDDDTGTMWFGTDANQIGRIVTRAVMP